MYLQKVISIKNLETVFFVGILKATEERARAGSESESESGPGSVSQCYLTTDPDTHQYKNVTDPQHCHIEPSS